MIYFDAIKPKLYKTNNVTKGQKFYFNLLLESITNMFVYKDVYEGLETDFLEISIITKGFGAVFRNPKNTNEIVTTFGGLSGVDKYYQPTTFTWGQPIMGSGVQMIDETCAVIYNTKLDRINYQGMTESISRYANQLANIDASIYNVLVLSRASKTFESKNNYTSQSVEKYMSKLENGDISFIDNGTAGVMGTLSINEATTSSYGELLTKLYTLKKEVMCSFYESLGIKYARPKRAEMTSEEVKSGNQPLIINPFDMLDQRKKGVERINKLFGGNMTVELNPIYDVLQSFDEKEESNYDDNKTSVVE